MQEAIEQIAVGKLKLADDNVRDDLGDLTELAASMRNVGVLEPLLVREEGLLVVCGSRRLEAAKVAGLKEVPVILGSYTDEARITAMAVENLQRQSLTPLEEARTFQRLRDLDLTTRQVAKRVGVSQSWVVKRLALLKLPEETQKAVSAGKIEIGAATELVRLADDPALVVKLAKRAENGSRNTGLDVQQAVETRDRAKQQAAKEKELEKAGEKVVHLVDEFYNAKPPKGVKMVVSSGYYGDPGRVIHLDPAKHAKQDCHAVGVHPRTGEVIECCTKPGKHPDPEQQRQKAEEKRKAEAAAAKERERAELEHQAAFLHSAAVKPSREMVLDAAFLALTEGGYSYSHGELALRLLDLTEQPEPKDGEEPLNESQWAKQELEKLASTTAGKLRVTFAFAVDRLYGIRQLEVVLDLLGYAPPKPKLEIVKDEVEKAA